MPTSKPLANVVQHAAEVQDLRFGSLADQSSGEREFLLKVPLPQAAQLLDEEEGVNVYRVGVVHVLLPEAHEAPELRQVGAQQTQLVHHLQ